jgi:hypothetical protein
MELQGQHRNGRRGGPARQAVGKVSAARVPGGTVVAWLESLGRRALNAITTERRTPLHLHVRPSARVDSLNRGATMWI